MEQNTNGAKKRLKKTQVLIKYTIKTDLQVNTIKSFAG